MKSSAFLPGSTCQRQENLQTRIKIVSRSNINKQIISIARIEASLAKIKLLMSQNPSIVGSLTPIRNRLAMELVIVQSD